MVGTHFMGKLHYYLMCNLNYTMQFSVWMCACLKWLSDLLLWALFLNDYDRISIWKARYFMQWFAIMKICLSLAWKFLSSGLCWWLTKVCFLVACNFIYSWLIWYFHEVLWWQVVFWSILPVTQRCSIVICPQYCHDK